MSKFSMKLFEVITEESETVSPAESFLQILKEVRGKRSNIEILPVQKEVFAQLAANLILHLATPEEALPIVIECYKNSQLEPCLYHSFYNPKAVSDAIKFRQEPIKVGHIFNSSFAVMRDY